MKLRTIGICFLLIIAILCGLALPAGVALADSTPILLLSGKATDEDITVTVSIRGNEGISSMLLSLVYDREKLVLVGLEQGSALSSLHLLPTNPDGPDGYAAYPFNLYWMGDDNDKTNGHLLTLHFAPVSEDVQGEATVTFSYVRDRDVNYIEKDGERKTEKTLNLLVDTLHIDMSKGKPTQIEGEIEDPEPSTQKDNTSLAVGLTLGAVALVSLAVGLPLLWRKKHL